MTIYRVSRCIDGTVVAHVVRGKSLHSRCDDAYRLQHVMLHSPTGFETGYGGSGPADLALSILADHFGEDAAMVELEWRGNAVTEQRRSKALRLHQEFKAEVIAGQMLKPGDHYDLDEQFIREWVAAKEPSWAQSIGSAVLLILALLPWLFV